MIFVGTGWSFADFLFRSTSKTMSTKLLPLQQDGVFPLLDMVFFDRSVIPS
jgi:hypothetical protein